MIARLEGNVTAEKVRVFVFQAKRTALKYGWMDEVVHPWAGCPVKVGKIISDMDDFEKCSQCSKDMLIDMANGLARILNAWEEHELNGVWVRVKSSGKMARVERDFAEEMVKCGACEMVGGEE